MQAFTYEVCLTVNKADGFCMYCENSDSDPKPVVLMSITEETGIVPNPEYVHTILTVLDNHWGGTCW